MTMKYVRKCVVCGIMDFVLRNPNTIDFKKIHGFLEKRLIHYAFMTVSQSKSKVRV